jgi:hypothetical protein
MTEAVPQGLSVSLWAVAKLAWGEALLQPLPNQQQQQQQQQREAMRSVTGADGYDGGSVVSGTWLGVFCCCSLGQLDAFSDQALSNCCWALGSIRQQLQQQQQQQQQFQQILQQSGLQQRLLAVLQPRLLGLSPQQLANTLWGLATAGLKPSEPWLASFVRASGPKLLGFKAQEASNTLLGLARLGFNPGKAWLSLYEAAVGQQLAQCSSQVISNSCWAMLVLQHSPSEMWLQQQLLPEVCRRLQMPLRNTLFIQAANLSAVDLLSDKHGDSSSSSSIGRGDLAFTPHGMSVLLLCLAQMSVKHSAAAAGDGDTAADGSSSSSSLLPGDFWQLALQQVVGMQQQQQLQQQSVTAMPDKRPCSGSSSDGLSQFTPQGLAYLAGAAVLADAPQQSAEQLVLAVLARFTLQQQQFNQPCQVRLADAAMVLWAAARLQLQPPPDQLLAVASAALQQLQHVSSGGRAAQGSALQNVASHQVSSSSSSGGEAAQVRAVCGPGLKYIGAMIYALAVMGFHPGSVWFSAWFGATQPLLQYCSAWTLALLLWGCVWLQQVPPAGWLASWQHAWQQQQQQQRAQQVAAAAAVRGLWWLRATAAEAADAAQRLSESAASSSSSSSSGVYGAAPDRAELYRLCIMLSGRRRQQAPTRSRWQLVD